MSFSPLHISRLANDPPSRSSSIRRPLTPGGFQQALADLVGRQDEPSPHAEVLPDRHMELERLASLSRMAGPVEGNAETERLPSAMRQEVEETGPADASAEALGALSAPFESGGKGAGAIGHDHLGGTCYGLYQFSSRQGTMRRFLAFLDKSAPDLAGRLRAAGPADTGGRSGAMPQVWRAIGAEQPERFAALQQRFVGQSHYDPVVTALAEKNGLDLNAKPQAVREVVFSTAVQHGPDRARRIVARAVKGLREEDRNDDAKVIERIYALRGRQFGGSPEAIQRAVTRRLHAERQQALAMLRRESGTA